MEAYLDNSATTIPSVKTRQAVMKAVSEVYGNPSSIHEKGFEALKELESSRNIIAKSLFVDANTIYFSPSGTLANNTAIFSSVKALKRRGNKIVSTAFEHPSVENCLLRLEAEGFEVVRVFPQKDGNIPLSEFEKVIDENTILVSVMAVNNEIGAITPFSEIKKIIKSKKSNAVLHIDAIQGYMKMPINPQKCGIDLMSMSAHKIHGIKGVGALYVDKNVKIKPYVEGGGQENNLFSGTQGMPAIMGFSAAIEDFGNIAKNLEYVKELNCFFKDRIKNLAGVFINSPENALPYILNISVLGIPSQVLVNFFSMNKVYVSAGSACSKGHRSNVLNVIGLSPAKIDTAIRISLSHNTTKEELEYCAEILEKAITTLRKGKN
ncbi:MAG: cysteine desulfurase family protein [Oscillospiraceae bacterium]